jgi:hypothetical protein
MIETLPLHVPTLAAPTSGNILPINDLWDLGVQVDNIGAGAVRIHGSVDGLTFYPMGASITADGLYAFTERVRYVRVVRTGVSAGTTKVSLIGRFLRAS